MVFSNYLNGKDGRILKQKIAKGQWKPIRDVNQVEPHGYDVISTIDVFIQDIAHHALLKTIRNIKLIVVYCKLLWKQKTGYVKAISNLGRNEKTDEF